MTSTMLAATAAARPPFPRQDCAAQATATTASRLASPAKDLYLAATGAYSSPRDMAVFSPPISAIARQALPRRRWHWRWRLAHRPAQPPGAGLKRFPAKGAGHRRNMRPNNASAYIGMMLRGRHRDPRQPGAINIPTKPGGA
jgi:hypothetical protein